MILAEQVINVPSNIGDNLKKSLAKSLIPFSSFINTNLLDSINVNVEDNNIVPTFQKL